MTDRYFLLGCIATEHGGVRHVDVCGDPIFSRIRTIDYQERQPATIPLLAFHDKGWVIGQVVHLEARRDMFAFAELNEHGVDLLRSEPAPWSLSAGITGASCEVNSATTGVTAVKLREVSLTHSPAARGVGEVRWASGFQHRSWPLGLEDTWVRGVAAADVAADLADWPSLRSKATEVYDSERIELEELMARSRANNASRPKPRTPPPMPAARAEVGEYLGAGVHRRYIGEITSWDGRPVTR